MGKTGPTHFGPQPEWAGSARFPAIAAAPAPRACCAPTASLPRLPARSALACAPAPGAYVPRASPRHAREPAARLAPCRGLADLVAALCCDTVQQPTAFAIIIQFLYCDTIFPPASLLCCNTIVSPSNYIAIHLPPRPATAQSCNTILQYTSLQPAFSCNTINCIAIQFSSSQAAQVTIQLFYCNTNFQPSFLLLAIQFQYCNTIFFFTI